MNNWKKYTSLLLALVLRLSLAACGGETEEKVEVTLANQCGQAITSLCIAATTSDKWGDELVDGIFRDGEIMKVTLGSYKPSELPGFNILAYGEAGNVLYDTNAEFTLHGGDYIVFQSPDDNPGITICTSDEYDELYAGYGGTGNEDPDISTTDNFGLSADISGYTGCWKVENEPLYFLINDAYEWAAINLYNDEIGLGYVVAEEDCITLCMEDGEEVISLWKTAYGDLSDINGNTLTLSDNLMLLPTPEDALTETAYFPDGFSNVSIDYPIQMEAHAHPNVQTALSFNAVMEDGTDDYYSNIVIAFQPISGYDSYMEQGAATAEPYMVRMLNDFLNTM